MRDLFFLTCGTFRAPALAVAPPTTHTAGSLAALRGATRMVPLSNTVGVVVRDSGDVVLVDAGWSREACADFSGAIGTIQGLTLGVDVEEGDAIADQLAALGIEPSRVTCIVATHLHLDHVGAVTDFANAELVVTKRELEAYRRFPPAFGYRRADLAKAGRLREVALDATPTYGFPSSFDLFGDGEVVLLDARGHTRGLAAVAMRADGECYVHIGDAVYQSWELGMSPQGPSLFGRITAWKTDELKATYARVRACEADPRKPTIVPSHDMAVFDRLPHAPER